MYRWMNVMDFIIWDIRCKRENKMEKQEKKNSIERDMSWKMYQILVITAGIANLLGTVCNFIIHGTEIPTMLCGACFLIVIVVGSIGWNTKKTQLPAVLIILMLTWFEFPYLYYCYGNAAIVYLILGIVGLAMFFPRRMVIISYLFTLLEYLAIMSSSFARPSRWSVMDERSRMGTTFGSFLIVALSIFAMTFVLLRRYEEQREQLLAMSEELEFAANHDPLTKLYNRRFLVRCVEEWMRIPGKSFWIILMDVDDFKAVNDTYGHGYGDDVLREAGRLMLEQMQGRGIASRFGGEEFMLVFEQDDREQALLAFQKIQEGLLSFARTTRQTDITISGGMERYEADKQLDQLFTSADRKLYTAKNTGKNRLVE